MLMLRDFVGLVQRLKITEIHRKSIFYEPWFQILISCKTLQLIDQVVSIKCCTEKVKSLTVAKSTQ